MCHCWRSQVSFEQRMIPSARAPTERQTVSDETFIYPFVYIMSSSLTDYYKTSAAPTSAVAPHKAYASPPGPLWQNGERMRKYFVLIQNFSSYLSLEDQTPTTTAIPHLRHTVRGGQILKCMLMILNVLNPQTTTSHRQHHQIPAPIPPSPSDVLASPNCQSFLHVCQD